MSLLLLRYQNHIEIEFTLLGQLAELLRLGGRRRGLLAAVVCDDFIAALLMGAHQRGAGLYR